MIYIKNYQTKTDNIKIPNINKVRLLKKNISMPQFNKLII